MWRAVGPRRLRLYVLCADEVDTKLWRVLMLKCNTHTATVPELTLEQVRTMAPKEGWPRQDPLHARAAHAYATCKVLKQLPAREKPANAHDEGEHEVLCAQGHVPVAAQSAGP